MKSARTRGESVPAGTSRPKAKPVYSRTDWEAEACVSCVLCSADIQIQGTCKNHPQNASWFWRRKCRQCRDVFERRLSAVAESGKGDNVPLYTSFLKTKASVDKKNKTLTGNVRRPIEDNQTASGRSGAELSDTTMWSNVSGPPPILVALQGTPAVPTVSYPSYDEKITRAFNTLEKFTDKANSQKMQSQARALEAQTNAEGVAVKPTDSVFCPPRVTSVGRFTGPEVANQRNVVALGKSYVSKGVPFRV